MNLTEQELDAFVCNRVKEAIYRLLHPTVEIVSLDNPVPEYATPGDAGADIRASINRIQIQFMKNAYIKTNVDFLHDELEEAFQQENKDIVNQLWEIIDETEEQPEAIVIKPGGHCLVPTGIFTAFPELYVADIVPRSGLALKMRITITNSPGKIDCGYRNEWGLIIDNEGDKDFIIRQGDRIAQVQFSLKCQANFVQVANVEELSGIDRGGGFGHTLV
jgi:dUTP pyrophosphatase